LLGKERGETLRYTGGGKNVLERYKKKKKNSVHTKEKKKGVQRVKREGGPRKEGE